MFGAAVTFYEEYPEEKLTDYQMRHLGLKNKHIREQYRIMKTVHYNKSICLLSHWPFFDAFRKLLSYLYRISITGPHTVPIERYLQGVVQYFFGHKMRVFPFQSNSKNLDPSYEMDLDFLGLFWKGKNHLKAVIRY